MRTNIGFIRNENGLTIFENTLFDIHKEYNLLVKFRVIKHIFWLYDDYIKLIGVWGQKNRFILLCEQSIKFRNEIIKLPEVIKQIKKEVYVNNDDLETKDKIFNMKVERFLYFMCRDIFLCDRNYKGY